MKHLLKFLAIALLTTAPLHLQASEPTIESNILPPAEAFTTRVWDAEYLGQYRIPGIAETKDQILLAVVEKRDAQGDQKGNDLVMKRSLDGGRTWGTEQFIGEAGADAMNNPSLLVSDKNLVALFYNVFLAGKNLFSAATPPSSFARVLVIYSSDNGGSWTTPIDITDQVTPSDAVLTNVGPGTGFIMQNGPHKGRAIMGSYVKYSLLRDLNDTRAQAIYSDEFNEYVVLGGKKITQKEAEQLSLTWAIGGNNNKSRANEISMIEFGTSGSLYYMARLPRDAKTGGFFYDSSTDAGETWGGHDKTATFFPYRTQSGLFGFNNSDNTKTYVFTTPVGPYTTQLSKGRTDGRIVATLEMSGNNLTWTNATNRVITDNFMSNTSTVQVTDPVFSTQRVGVLYEGNTSKSQNKVRFINFSNVNLDYVRSGPRYSRPTPH